MTFQVIQTGKLERTYVKNHVLATVDTREVFPNLNPVLTMFTISPVFIFCAI